MVPKYFCHRIAGVRAYSWESIISPQILACRTSSAQSRARVLPAAASPHSCPHWLTEDGLQPIGSQDEEGWEWPSISHCTGILWSSVASQSDPDLSREGWRTPSGWDRSLKTMSSAGTRTVRAARETRKPTTTLSWGKNE